MKTRILVVDDEPSILDLFSNYLVRWGYQVEVAATVDDALAKMAEIEYDLIITDKNIPDAQGRVEGGMEILRYAREHWPHTEVIMISGYATVETAVEAMKLGAFEYIVKPVEMHELKTKIDRIMDYRRSLNSSDTLRAYRILRRQILHHLANTDNLPNESLEQVLKNLGARIDHLFGTQREYENLIQTQSQAMERIEVMARSLLDTTPNDHPHSNVIDQILLESRRRV